VQRRKAAWLDGERGRLASDTRGRYGPRRAVSIGQRQLHPGDRPVRRALLLLSLRGWRARGVARPALAPAV